MPPALRPLSEKDRLRALREYRILDTPPEQAYDDLAGLASQICETPIAVISLLDEQRQWFKARVGVTVQETSREAAFCAHTILGTETLVIPDATDDPRFADSALVVGQPRIRFYAGAPLISLSGQALGAMCVMDRVPRTLTSRQLAGLEMLARQAVTHLELRRITALLAGALDRSRTLSGLLPICAYCKRVRDDQESWGEVERYIEARAPVEFTHSICPSCLAEEFPEIG